MSFSFLGFTIIRTGELTALRARADAPRRPGPEPLPPEPSRLPPEGPLLPPEPSVMPPVPTEGPPAAAREVIRLADGLLDLRGSLDLTVDDGQAATVLRWVESRTKALLTSCDIKRVEESGVFDPARQHAAASREAPRPELAHQIASTVRPGYVWHGVLLRPQQVVVYVPVND
jgi:hypothetical protein